MKVGDKVRVVSVEGWQREDHEVDVGDIGYVEIFSGRDVGVKFSGKVYCVYFEFNQLEPINKPKRYTLTEYVKPETVTINGVEYIMTENA